MKVYIVYDRTLETTIGVYTNRREAEKEFREATTDPARTLLGDVLTDEEGNIQYHCIELKQDVIKLNKRSIG